jgi:hypothetical protein
MKAGFDKSSPYREKHKVGLKIKPLQDIKQEAKDVS